MTGRIKHRIASTHADTPTVVAARRVLEARLDDVRRYLELVHRPEQAEDQVEAVHQLRVSTRRAAAALRVFRRLYEPRDRKRLGRALRDLRRAATAARRADVELERLHADWTTVGSNESTVALDQLESQVLSSRQEAIGSLGVMSGPDAVAKLRKLAAKVIASIKDGAATGVETNGSPFNLREMAAADLPAVVQRMLDAAAADLFDLSAAHQLRIAGKELRYTLEILAEGLCPQVAQDAYAYLEALQDRLGELNDLSDMADAIAGLGGAETNEDSPIACSLEPSCALQELVKVYVAHRDAKHHDFLAWLDGHAPQVALGPLLGTLGAQSESSSKEQGQAGGTASGNGRHARPPHRRIAAIDVGTNSVRLVVAETDPARGFHIVEDMKETTRLGAGVYTTGRLQPAAVEKTVAALERMRSVAASKNVEQVRAVGTSAVREAVNRAEFLEQALRRTGIDIEILDADSEARLAFSSVANSFAMDDRCVAVADIGGGSTELVLSTSGVIDAVYPLPLGAVRLTELYAGGTPKGDYRYDEMEHAITRVISERLHNTRHRPFQIIGTGGTFTSLARLANYKEPAGGGPLRFSFAVGGYEFRRAQVTRLLDWLRAMPLDERKKLPGLSSARAEIIVAGVCIVEKLMQYFGVDRLRVHDGGIRDGLLLQMVAEMGVCVEPPRARGPETIEAVRRFAESCEYEAAHSEHVAFLSLRIFDQLARQGLDLAGVWTRLDHRMLLHAAAILHDIGMLLGVRRHHRSSYEMILHGDLSALTRREVEIIANISRYHRRRGPSRKDPNFRRLSDDDQNLVSHLAGILRIADGLDRSHRQLVHDVLIEVTDDEVVFRAVAARRPKEELRFAARKADVFQAAFRAHARVRFVSEKAVADAEAIGAGI